MELWFTVATPAVQMPLLSSQFLQKHRELRLAHLALSVMTMGYAWQEGENDTVEVSLFQLCFVMLTFSFPISLTAPSCNYSCNLQFILMPFHLQ